MNTLRQLAGTALRIIRSGVAVEVAKVWERHINFSVTVSLWGFDYRVSQVQQSKLSIFFIGILPKRILFL